MTPELPISEMGSSEVSPAEEARLHTRILRCALEVDDCRAWWRHMDPDGPRPGAEQAYSEWWFGNRSLARVELLMQNMRARFDAFPPSLRVLRRWDSLGLDEARLVCHWHLQLSDPLYRRFTGEHLPALRAWPVGTIERDAVIGWVREHGLLAWGIATRAQFASKLLSAAHEAGLILSNRDPRPLGLPTVPDRALAYLLYLLRGLRFEGTLLENPYLRSVGLNGDALRLRLRGLPELAILRLGDTVEIGWRHEDLLGWAADLPVSRGAA